MAKDVIAKKLLAHLDEDVLELNPGEFKLERGARESSDIMSSAPTMEYLMRQGHDIFVQTWPETLGNVHSMLYESLPLFGGVILEPRGDETRIWNSSAAAATAIAWKQQEAMKRRAEFDIRDRTGNVIGTYPLQAYSFVSIGKVMRAVVGDKVYRQIRLGRPMAWSPLPKNALKAGKVVVDKPDLVREYFDFDGNTLARKSGE